MNTGRDGRTIEVLLPEFAPSLTGYQLQGMTAYAAMHVGQDSISVPFLEIQPNVEN
jgi:phage tail tube protein FII